MPVSIASITLDDHYSGFAIGNPNPKISWRFNETEIKNWHQTSYEIVITRKAKEEQYRANSDQSIHLPWPSSPLASREIADIRARVTGSDGSTSDWASVKVEAGLLKATDWVAEMITSSRIPNPDLPKPPTRFRKSFSYSLPNKTNTTQGKARLYATAYGIYQVELNGKRVGDQVLTPGWQSYEHHLNYQTYDISDLLMEGENVIGVDVGEGWYAGRLGRPGLRICGVVG
jgi:alpha-L-rhamnosidase